MPVVLKSGLCASREEAVEEMKKRRSTVHPSRTRANTRPVALAPPALLEWGRGLWSDLSPSTPAQTPGSGLFWRTLVIMELFEVQNCTDASDCHRYEVNPTVRSEVMPVVLKSGLSASREEAVEEVKERRSTVHPWCRSAVIPEHGKSIFQDQIKPKSNHKLPEYP
ncbi:hypothetical protein F2Q69_00046102 [Brassica cretica]|uniref:Uncharacterized protein n=1 Tax=Brassica cretica TaxID=69181 RepID=A0A8S9PG54_BRACR|nr:hypothetical protein F2Q69_00046102 [Brassica cretica]